MHHTAWIETTVEVAAPQAETMASFLFDLGSPGLVTDDGESSVKLTAYFAVDGHRQVTTLYQFCDQLAVMAPDLPRPRIVTCRIEQQDWAHSWQLHFPPLVVGERLYVAPPWAEQIPADRLAIVINPGLAFGTGHHATTQGCLILLERVVDQWPVRRALDVGTGSGILAIAMARLGVAEVWAIDTDSEARRAATENCRRNGVGQHACVAANLQEVIDHARRFDLITANLSSPLLIEFTPTLATALAVDGHLIVSGMLIDESASVIDAFAAHGLAERARHQGTADAGGADSGTIEWLTLHLARPCP